jgi:hypothetical protein
MENFQLKKNYLKNLAKRKTNILPKTQHLIHLTKKGIFFFDFFVCLIFFMYMIKKFKF